MIGDANNLYDLNRMDDQWVLGIKGTLSVVELNTLKLRLQHGREAKAKRGELGRCLVFSKFAQLGSVRQTLRWFHEAHIELPVNKARGARFEMWRAAG